MILRFLDIDLERELALGTLRADRRQELLEQAAEVVDRRIESMLQSVLSEEDRRQLEELVLARRDVRGFLDERLPALDDLVGAVLDDFKLDLAEWLQKLQRVDDGVES